MNPITHISQLDPNRTYSYADYLTWRFEEQVELIKGKIWVREVASFEEYLKDIKRSILNMAPAPRDFHQSISGEIFGDIKAFLKRKKCVARHAPSDVRLMKTEKDSDRKIKTVVQPDIYVVCDPAKLDEYGCKGAPDWIIEILSPSTATKDLDVKYSLYEENGVKEYWIANPKTKAIERYVLIDGKYKDAGVYNHAGDKIPNSIFTDFVLDYDDIFREVGK
jgi:Uma2 family endonuclease